jgi:hypothetical protein
VAREVTYEQPAFTLERLLQLEVVATGEVCGIQQMLAGPSGQK